MNTMGVDMVELLSYRKGGVSLKKIISVFCSIAICFSLFIPVFAEESSSMEKGNFWDYASMYTHSMGSTSGGWIGAGFNFLGKLASTGGNVTCLYSDDHLHHGDPVRGGTRKGWTITLECVCDYCGETFYVDKTDHDLSAAYDDYVATLPADNINSQGLSNFYITLLLLIIWFHLCRIIRALMVTVLPINREL